MAVKNSTVLEKAWLEGSNDFQQRIPNPSISGYEASVGALFDPYNGQFMNEFANMLVGMMGTYVEGKLFENPLRELKKPAAEWGNTERHVAVKFLKSHAYNVNDETLLKLEKPEFQEWFYSVNQHRRYEFSWSRYELSRVFANGDSYGYDDLLTSTLNQQRSSDNYDEMNTMIQSFAVANDKYTLYKHNITAPPTTKELGQELLVKVRADAGMMQFPSTRYNQLDVPVFESPSTLVLWVTPETDAYLDVMALAELFHVERAEVNFRKILIPEFPIPNVYAALTSEDFVYARDVWYGIEPPFYNPANRTYKYYLFHDEMMGVNPAANCILYTTDEGTSIPSVTVKATGMVFEPARVSVPVGGTIQLTAKLNGSVTGGNGSITVQPQGATYELSCDKPLNTRTYVDNDGVLHVQKSGLDAGDVITVTGTSTYENPSGETTEYSATCTVTLTAAKKNPAKGDFVDDNPNITYTQKPDTAYTPGA